MASWEPIITDEQYQAWQESFVDRHGGTVYQVLNAIVPGDDAAYAEAYAAWTVHQDRVKAVVGGLDAD